MKKRKTTFPNVGSEKEMILSQLQSFKKEDTDWQAGKSFGYVFSAGPELMEMAKAAYMLFFSENALNPMAFRSLLQMENEVIAMVTRLLGGDELTRGNLTSGGTESIFLAVHAAREYAKTRKINQPEVIIPSSAHPAFHKACHYLGLKAITIPERKDFKTDLSSLKAAINQQTILLVASAPSFPRGMIDPIEQMGQLALDNELLLHVDACMGGFVLPFLKSSKAFDLSVPGVSSISADIHKYGYGAKGASILLYRQSELRKHQFYIYADWPGGIYASTGFLGTRSGGAIAAAWAVIQYLGIEGYQRKVEDTMAATYKLQAGIRQFPELKILGQPEMTIFSVASDQINIYQLADELQLKGWTIDRQQMPPSLHFTITPIHLKVVNDFLQDLKEALTRLKKKNIDYYKQTVQIKAFQKAGKWLPAHWVEPLSKWSSAKTPAHNERSAALYGMMVELQKNGNLDPIIRDLLDKMMR